MTTLPVVRPAAAEAPRDRDALTVALAQIAPVWLDREASVAKVADAVRQAGDEGAGLVCFGEALVPGYPFWVERTDGARFEAEDQKTWYAHYLDQGVDIEAGHLAPVQEAARQAGAATYLGVMERAPDRGGHTVYASLVYIAADGQVGSVHRKLQPTYEERLVWGMGDGHGLRVHPLGPFTAGGLNCWENWLPLARASLYGQGEDLHVAVWPGGIHNTERLTPVMALEGRSYALSVSGVFRGPDEATLSLPGAEVLRDGVENVATGGSCIAGPDGEWVIPPQGAEECLCVATLDHAAVRRARHSLDIAGHYSRPDVLTLSVDRTRLSTVRFND